MMATEKEPSMSKLGPTITKFKNQGNTRKKEPEQGVTRVKVSESGDPGQVQGIGADFIMQEPLKCAHVPSSGARSSTSTISSSSISPVAILWKDKTIDNLRLTDEIQRDGSIGKKNEPHSNHKKDNEMNNVSPKFNTDPEKCSLTQTFKRQIQNQRKYNYNSKLCDVSIFGTKTHPNVLADNSTKGSTDSKTHFPQSRSPSGSQAGHAQMKDKKSSSYHAKVNNSAYIDETGPNSTEKNSSVNPCSMRVVNAKKIYEFSEARTIADYENKEKVRLKPKMATAIKSIQERLLKEMEEDPNKIKKPCDSTKVQVFRPKCTWTPGMLAGMARKRSLSRYSGVTRRASRYISPNKRERPYRQWLGMSTCVTTDTKFIIASVQQTTDGVGKEASVGRNTCSVGTQLAGGRVVKSRDVNSRERRVEQESRLRRRSSVRQSPDSYKSTSSKEVPGLFEYNDIGKIVRPNNTTAKKINTIQRSEDEVTEIPVESHDIISGNLDISLQEANAFESKIIETSNYVEAETTYMTCKELKEASDVTQADVLLNKADNAKINSAHISREESTKTPVGGSVLDVGCVSPGLSSEAVGIAKYENVFGVYSENLTDDMMNHALKMITRSRKVTNGDDFNRTRMDSSAENSQLSMKEQEFNNLGQENTTVPKENLEDSKVVETQKVYLNTLQVEAGENLSAESNELTESGRSQQDFMYIPFPIDNGCQPNILGDTKKLENIPDECQLFQRNYDCTSPILSPSQLRNTVQNNEEESVNKTATEVSASSCSCPVPNKALDTSVMSASSLIHFKLSQQDTNTRNHSLPLPSTVKTVDDIKPHTLNLHKRLYGNHSHNTVNQQETESLPQKPFSKISPKVVTFMVDKAHEDSFISTKIADCPVSGNSVFQTSYRERYPATQSNCGVRGKSQFSGEEIDLIPSSIGMINSFLNSPQAFTSVTPKQYFRMSHNKLTRCCDKDEEDFHQSKMGGNEKSRANVAKEEVIDTKSSKVTVDLVKSSSSKHLKDSKYKYVQALVDFQGILPGQLNFNKGQIIRQRCVHDVCGMRYGSYRVGRLKKKRKGLYPASCVTDYPPKNQQLI